MASQRRSPWVMVARFHEVAHVGDQRQCGPGLGGRAEALEPGRRIAERLLGPVGQRRKGVSQQVGWR